MENYPQSKMARSINIFLREKVKVSSVSNSNRKKKKNSLWSIENNLVSEH